MKKILFLFAAMLCITGCGTDPKEELQAASSKMQELENYNMNMTMDIEIGGEDMNFSMTMVVDSDYDVKNETGKMTMSTSFMGEEVAVDSYFKSNDGKVITYTEEEEDVWVYTEGEEESGSFEFDVFKDATEITKVKHDGEGKKYQIKLSKEDIKTLLSGTDTEESISVEDVQIFVYINDNYITQMDLNMPMNYSESGIEMAASAKMIIKFSKFNEVGSITIPEEVLDNATDGTIEEIENYVYDYIWEVEYAIIDTDLESGIHTYTDNSLEYDGPKPSEVELELEDGYVTDGYIVINGYKATIVDGWVEEVVAE